MPIAKGAVRPGSKSDPIRRTKKDGGQKKARALPTGPWKFWERMPERQVLYDSNRVFVQVRNGKFWLQKLQTWLHGNA
jgi:hypothetical protein